MAIDDKNSAVETVSREKATSDPGSVGATMSGVVVEVRVKEGHEIKKGDPLCGKVPFTCDCSALTNIHRVSPVLSAMKVSSFRTWMREF